MKTLESMKMVTLLGLASLILTMTAATTALLINAADEFAKMPMAMLLLVMVLKAKNLRALPGNKMKTVNG